MTEVRSRGEEFALPVGTVTLLLSDVEGSTRQWETDPDAMAKAVARLDDAVAEVIGRHGGVRPVEQGEGDSFVAAFARASDAVAAALDLQQAPLEGLRLRIGIHTGEVRLRDARNYVGATVNRCARVRDLGHGGQTLMSHATAELVTDRLPPECWLDDLGTHRLRDLARPERIHQLGHPDLSTVYPPLRSLDAFPHNLPVQLTTFIGRREELSKVADVIAENRLVTLVGSGGCGKTRLALQVAADAMTAYADGVWLAELATITDPDVVATVVLRALGLKDEIARSPTETITHHMKNRSALLVLDNCEHLIDASADLVAAMLRACPTMTLLATSREPLGIEGEVTWRVPSLALPDDERPRIEGLSQSEAVQLFVDRARRTRPGFELTDANAAAVLEICRRLEGIPLAIELAAARMRVFSPERIAAELHDTFRVLTGGARTAVPRQQTLRASVEWSHALLSDAERTVFRRLGVFAGAVDFEAAEAVAAGDAIEPHHVLDQLALLVDKSLVLAEDGDAGETRYRLLETVRQYALEQLNAADELDSTRRRHRDHYLALAESASEHWRDSLQSAMADRVVADLDEMRPAFTWSREQGDNEEALRMAWALEFPMTLSGYQSEMRSWIESALADNGNARPRTRITALVTAALQRSANMMPGGTPYAEEAVARARELGDDVLLGRALAALGHARSQTRGEYRSLFAEATELAERADDPMMDRVTLLGQQWAENPSDPAFAARCAEESLRIATARGDGFSERGAMQFLGLAVTQLGEVRRGAELLRAAAAGAKAAGDRHRYTLCRGMSGWPLALLGEIDLAREASRENMADAADIGMPFFGAFGLGNLGAAALVSGRLDGAADASRDAWTWAQFVPGVAELTISQWAHIELSLGHLDEARALADQGRTLGPNAEVFQALATLTRARVAAAEDQPELAESLVHEALATWRPRGVKLWLPDAFELLATLAVEQESLAEAARLLGAATALRRQMETVRYAVDQPAKEALDARLREGLGTGDYEDKLGQGEALSADEAIAYAQRGRGERKRPSFGWASLTPAELEVAGLVADGLSNKAIGERLFISARTVQTHLTHIFSKLDLDSRGHLAAEVHRRTT